jgi:hypothetical protein
MAVPDSFGRVRVLLMSSLPNGKADRGAELLRVSLPFSSGLDLPFRLHARDAEDTVGEFWAVPPAHRRRYWLDLATELRGTPVRVEVTLRPYTFPVPGAVEPSTEKASVLHGVAFDVAMIEKLSS